MIGYLAVDIKGIYEDDISKVLEKLDKYVKNSSNVHMKSLLEIVDFLKCNVYFENVD